MNLSDAMRVDGATAFVTGASRGLGRTAALALAEAGADLALAATDPGALEGTAEAVRALGRRAISCPLDVSDPAAVRTAVERTATELGRLDIAVNAAGVCPRLSALETSEETLRQTFDVNLHGTFYVCTAVAPHMERAGGGRIVNFGSVAGLRARAKLPVYAASKAAVHILTQSLAADWAPMGIRVNAIVPGQFDTDMGDPLLSDPRALASYLKRIPMGRVATPEEIAAAVVYLCAEASSYVTGALVVMDGGLTLQ